MYPPKRPRRRHVRSPTASPRIAPIGAAPGGRLLAGLDNSFNYTVDDERCIASGRDRGGPRMKTLYLTGGTMGVGKTATARCLRDLLPHAVRAIAELAPAAR